ncbi:MAG: hypothetical protein GX575_00815 [Candidatus Anammoximicrobium sp.]|nr:hypothetical protein [Candidatus Anammoximicrobium sp.]
MKTGLLTVAVALSIWAVETAWAVSPTAAELAEARLWAAARFAGVQLAEPPQGEAASGAEPFFSFTYDGRPSVEALKTWEFQRESRPGGARQTQHTLAWTDPKTGLVLRCVGIEYADFPTVEWTLFFRNPGARKTPILADIRALDIRVERGPAPNREGASSEFRLHHHVGSPCTAEDYRPLETVLKPGMTKRIAAAGGRPTNSDLSYFNLQRSGGDGLIVVVGWPGQWAAEFVGEDESRVRIRAGQELTRLKLLPGEEIRTPRIVLQFWKGDRLRSQNLWRRWMLAHNVPRLGGQLPPLILSASSSYYYEIMYRADAASQKMFFDRYLEEGMKLDYWWMDAGWYPCDPVGWPKTGTWEVDRRRFPKGLREISDYVQARGAKTIVWFEPERVRADTALAQEHPEWILGGSQGGVLNLGNPDAWTWLVDHIDKLLVEEGIGLYRQDFNIDPLAKWRANDAPDRQGMTEIKHVVGYLAFWDELRRRHPDMLIDTCSSGGRRNDLETLKRAIPLLRSDYLTPGIAQQCQTYGIASWMPYFGMPLQDVWDNLYLLRSGLCPELTLRFDMRKRERDFSLARRLVDHWRQFGRSYLGDYYPLTPYTLDANVWMAWQFDCPESGEGLVQAFRREQSGDESARLKLYGLEPEAVYTLTDLDVPGATRMTGRELTQDGLSIAIKDRPGAAIVTYAKRS